MGAIQHFTYGLEEIGKYYRDYVFLMDHWDRVLPGRVLILRRFGWDEGDPGFVSQ